MSDSDWAPFDRAMKAEAERFAKARAWLAEQERKILDKHAVEEGRIYDLLRPIDAEGNLKPRSDS